MPYILLTAVGPPDLRMANCLIAVLSWSTSPSHPSPHSLTQLTWCSGASWAPTFSEERSLSLQDEASYALLGAQIAPFLPITVSPDLMAIVCLIVHLPLWTQGSWKAGTVSAFLEAPSRAVTL